MSAGYEKEQGAQTLKGLKQLREEAGISVEELREKTKFSRSKLHALEEGDFANVGSETFVIGYIQSYARVVGFDAAPHIERYRQSIQAAPAKVEQTEARVAAPGVSGPLVKRSKLPNIKFRYWLFPLAAIWVGLAFIVGGNESSEQIEPHYSAEKALDTDLPSTPLVSDEQEASSARLEAVPNENPSADVAVVSDSTSEDSPTFTSLQLATSAESSVEPFVDAKELISGSTEEDILVFSFSDECWIEVTGADQQRLFADIRNKGDNLRLSGVGPFTVMLGNARATKLLVNGEERPITPLPNRRTLKFTVTP